MSDENQNEGKKSPPLNQRPLPSSGTTNPPMVPLPGKPAARGVPRTNPGPAGAGNGAPALPPNLRPLPSSGTTNPSVPVTPAGATGNTAGQAPGNGAQTTPPPPPPIDFAMRAPKKSWLLNPNAIKNLGCLFKMSLAFTVILIGGYCALVALNPKARKWATQGARDGSGGPTPFKALNQILAIPAQAIGKTNDVVAANNANVHTLDKVIAEEDGKNSKSHRASGPVADPFAAAPATKGPAAGTAGGGDGSAALSREDLIAMQEKQAALQGPATPEPVKDTATLVAEAANPYSFEKKNAANASGPAALPPVQLAGGIVISPASPEGAPAATAPFLYWVVGLNISGVFQSAPHRILLNNRLVYEGQVVQAKLGITFDHLEPGQKLIFFRDKTGAIVTRSF